ncbi:MAG: transposase [Bacillota bacterium]
MKRQKYSKESKLQVVKETLQTGNKAVVSRRFELSTNMVHRWVREYNQGKLNDVNLSENLSL